MKVIHTPCGDITGVSGKHDKTIAYKGIRYACAERWKYPVEITRWEGILTADRYGNCSYQPRAFYDEAKMPEKAFYYNEFRKNLSFTYSEDCLYLNIFTPNDAVHGDRLPVIIYIHGGSFTGGCGHELHFDEPVWPEKGVIGVTINYRLGPLGFMCLKELAEEAGHTGNYALFDQAAAISWIKHNIASFGGDPDNIILMGQSAGAMSVQQLCLSEMTRDAIAGAVMSSGGGVSRIFGAIHTPETFYPFWDKVMEEAGCKTLESFRKLDPPELFASWRNVQSRSKSTMATVPVIDGILIKNDGFKAIDAKNLAAIPYLAGSTSEDIAVPYIHKMAKDWCRIQAESGLKDSWCWFFDRRLPGDDNGAWHSSDLWYWFGTLDNGWRPFTDKDRQLSKQMVSYLTNFAKTKNPNGFDLPEWLPVKKGQAKVLRIGEGETRMGGVNIAKLTRTMLTNKAVGE